MTKKQLARLRNKIERARDGSVKAADLERLARKAGRKKLKGAAVKGSEPQWISTLFLNLTPLSIPHHGNKDIATGTKHSILNQIEDDLNHLELKLDEEENRNRNE